MALRVTVEDFNNLRGYLKVAKYNCMQVRRKFVDATLLTAVKLDGDSIRLMVSCGKANFAEWKLTRNGSRLLITVRSSFADSKRAAFIEERLGKYLAQRVTQERSWMEVIDKPRVRYKAGEVYVRRTRVYTNTKKMNISRAEKSGLVSPNFAAQLDTYNLALRFKPGQVIRQTP